MLLWRNLERHKLRAILRYDSIILILAMFLAIIAGDVLLFFSDNGGYPQPFSVIGLLYNFAYLWGLFKVRTLPRSSLLMASFLFIKLYSILFLNIFFQSGSLGVGGDAVDYHIPKALAIDLDYAGYLDYLLTIGGGYNGRLTHVLLSIYIKILSLLDFNLSYMAIHNIAFIFNAGLCIITLKFYRWIIIAQGLTEENARRALWFLAFNPYFITITGLPQKEALLFFGLAVFAFSLVSEKSKFALLLFSMFVISMERIYMVPLLLLIILFFHGRISLVSLLLLVLGAVFVELFVGVETAIYMHDIHSESLMETGDSYLGGFGFLNNLFRAYFAPFAFRNFLDENSDFSVLQNAHYFLFLFYPYIAIRASFVRLKFGVVIFITLIFVALLIPYHSSFKIFMIVFFGGLFIAPLINLGDSRPCKTSAIRMNAGDLG